MPAAAAAGSRERSSTAARAKSATAPLWLNSHRPAVNGAAPASSLGNGGVVERTAASTRPLDTTPASDANEASVQIGWARR